jgi:hypothetical protein
MFENSCLVVFSSTKFIILFGLKFFNLKIMSKLKLKVGEPVGEASKVRETEVSAIVSSGNVMISRKESSVL